MPTVIPIVPRTLEVCERGVPTPDQQSRAQAVACNAVFDAGVPAWASDGGRTPTVVVLWDGRHWTATATIVEARANNGYGPVLGGLDLEGLVARDFDRLRTLGDFAHQQNTPAGRTGVAR